MPRLRLALLLVLAGCAASRVATTDGLLPLWTAWQTPGPDRPYGACETSFGSYATDFGVRGLACETDGVQPLGALVAASGLAVFESGPHAPGTDGLGLDVGSTLTFGHYNPAFVRWAVANGIPGEGNPALRAATQAAYDARLQRLARVYWLVRQGLAAEGYPARVAPGPTKDYVRFLRGGPVASGASEFMPGGFSMYAFNERSYTVPGALGIDEEDFTWYAAQYEANSATGFWLRRAEDGTEATFHEGLLRLLTTYDGAWLAAHGG